MTEKQARFVSEYLKDLNATQAAVRAGYSVKVARQQGSENLSKPDIAAAIAVKQAKRFEADDLSAARVLEELRRLGLSDPRTFWRADGSLKPIGELTAAEASCLAGFEVVIKNAAAGDGKTDTVHKIKFWDKGRALELLAKHFALLTEQVNLSGGLKIIHVLDDDAD